MILYSLSLFILYIIAAISKSIMDTIKFHWSDSKFSNIKNRFWYEWFQSTGSKKYKTDSNGNFIPLDKAPAYYLWLYKPKYKELFWYSTTALVLFTDAWHFFQLIMLTGLQLIIISLILKPIDISLVHGLPLIDIINLLLLSLIILKFIWGVIFELFYSNILLIKKTKQP